MRTPASLTSSAAFAEAVEDDGAVAHEFCNRVGRQLGVPGEQLPLVGVAGQDLDRRRELVAGGEAGKSLTVLRAVSHSQK
jgi:hypothetical protein